MKKLFASILNFFRSLFKKRQAIPGPEPVTEIKQELRYADLCPEKSKKDWRTPAETRSLLKQLRPGVQLFDKAGNPMASYQIFSRRKIGVFVEAEDGRRWKIHFMGLQSKTFSPDLPS
jgi:hypothetical protein